jgi:hypothetical protein
LDNRQKYQAAPWTVINTTVYAYSLIDGSSITLPFESIASSDMGVVILRRDENKTPEQIEKDRKKLCRTGEI